MYIDLYEILFLIRKNYKEDILKIKRVRHIDTLLFLALNKTVENKTK